MVNTIVLAGRYVSIKKSIMTLSITLTKSDEEPYGLFVPVVMSSTLLKHVKEYISEGDIVGTKGYLDNLIFLVYIFLKYHQHNTFFCSQWFFL